MKIFKESIMEPPYYHGDMPIENWFYSASSDIGEPVLDIDNARIQITLLKNGSRYNLHFHGINCPMGNEEVVHTLDDIMNSMVNFFSAEDFDDED